MKKTIKIIFAVYAGLFCLAGFANATSTVEGELIPGLRTGISGTVVVAPSANLASGTYSAAQSVSLSAIGSSSISYTTDGSDPVCPGLNTYSGPIAITATTTLKAIACYPDSITSPVSSFEYIISISQELTPPSANPGGGTYTSAQSVTLSTTSVSTSIRYIVDGANPTCSTGTVYTTVISVSSTQTIKAIACYTGGASSVATFPYTINIPSGGGGTSPPAPTVKTGDINVDNKVNEYDFALMMSNWGQTGSGLSADLNKDGVVDEYDFAILMLHWGE